MAGPSKITVNINMKVPDDIAARAVKIIDWWMEDNFEDDTEAAQNWQKVKCDIWERSFQKAEAPDDD